MMIKKIVIGVAMTMLLSEATSFLTLQFLGLNQSLPLPWSGWQVLSQGFIAPVIVALFLVGTVILAWQFYRKAGAYRWVALMMLLALGILFFTAWFSLLIFKFWAGEARLFYPWESWQLLNAFPCHTELGDQLRMSYLIGTGISGLLIAIYFFHRHHPHKKVLGDAHFAGALEIKRAGFFEKEGLIVGKAWGHWLKAGGFEHVLVFAPTGSGKTRSISMPNLLTFEGSAVVNDNKQALWKSTSHYRKQHLGHECYLWSLSWSEAQGVNTFCYNPFDIIPDSRTERIKEIQRLAHILIPDGKGDLVWYSGSRKLFKLLTFYLLDTQGKIASLGEINRLSKQADFDGWLQEVLDTTEHYDPEFYRNGYSYLNNHPKTRASIMETFTGYFELFDDPVIDAATQKSDFDIRALRKKKITIYVAFSDDDMERLSPLLTIFWQQVISVMIQEIPDLKKEPYPVLLLLDEFSSLGKIERLRRSLKLLREYRVRCILMIQYIAQTMEKYTDKEAQAFTNIKTKVAFAPDGLEDAEFISKLLGSQTKKVKGGSSSDSQSSGGSTSTNYHYQAVPLLRPEQVMRMKDQRELVIRSGRAPIYAKQCVWYQEPELKHLPCGATTAPWQVLQQMAFKRSENLSKEARLHEEEVEFLEST